MLCVFVWRTRKFISPAKFFDEDQPEQLILGFAAGDASYFSLAGAAQFDQSSH